MSERERLESPPGDAGERTPVGPGDRDPIGELVRLAGVRPEVPPDRAARAEAAVRLAWEAATAARRRRLMLGWGAAAALAAGLALALGLAWWPRTPQSVLQVAAVARVAGVVETLAGDGTRQPLLPGARLTTGEVVATAGDGRVAIHLDAGPSLRLDVGSRLRFTAADRVTLEAGAVYVDSAGGAPIVVDTPWGVVEERGTQFEVRLAEEAVRVRVREGAIHLAAAVRSPAGGSWDAEAGSELTLTAAGRLSRAAVPPHGESWSWVQEIAPPFDLEGRSLGEFLAWVSRETGWQVSWREPGRAAAAGRTTLHGPIDGLSPEQAVAAVLPTCGLAHRLEGGTLHLFTNSP
jgi:ferric-dicitrate binding protein FerR (iron transport regulator)